MDKRAITKEDEGKPVVDSDGAEIGIVASVEDGTAYVDPSPRLAETVLAKLGWEDVEDEDRPLASSNVETVTETEIRLEG